MNTTYIFYHKSDHDGCLSAFLLRNWLDKQNRKYLLLPCDYGSEPYDRLDEINGNPVFLLDFCFEKEGVMKKIKDNSSSFTWIDHHQKSIQLFQDLNLQGLRTKEESACMLTFKYLYPSTPLPKTVERIGLFDCWKHGDRKEIIGLEYYLQSRELPPESQEWEYWVSLSDEDELLKYADMGWVAYKRNLIQNKEILKTQGFETELFGYRVLAVNSQEKGSMVFGEQLKDYDFCISFKFTPQCWIYGVYSLTNDCAEFCHRFYGGGGHSAAAGFQTRESVF
ncbi:MAG: hypothetical protein M0R48_10825, partial [Candidatus Omnitrophica bacterium]|nr:hypothetical protein [Candidatus Omnitrophota bacterium]